MATTRNKKPDYGVAIARRRDKLRKSQTFLENETNGELYRMFWHRLENGIKTPDTLTNRELSLMANVLEWTRPELEAALGLDPKTGAYIAEGHVIAPKPVASGSGFLEHIGEPYNPTVRLPVFLDLAAGIKGFEIHTEPDEFRLFDIRELPKGTDPAKLYLARANGDSMFEADMARPIPNGAFLIIEAGALPEVGNVVAAYIPELDLGVVKQYRQNDDGSRLLRSYKVGGPTFWASRYPDMRIEGVVRRVTFDP